jgi:hypothetical protein
VPKTLVLVLLVFCLLGCSSSQQDKEEEQFKAFIFPDKSILAESYTGTIKGAQLPTIGTIFAFDNPSEIFTVVAVAADSFDVKDSQGNFMTISDMPWLPPIQWGGGANNTDSGRRIIESSPNNPTGELKVGNKYSFQITTQNDRPAVIERNLWQCEITQSGEVQVTAGKTNSFEILCTEDGLQKVLVNYSPDLKFYVRHVLMTSKGPVVRQLTTYSKGG